MKTFALPALLAFVLSLLALGCAGTEKKVIAILNTITQGVDQAVATVNAVDSAVNQVKNRVDSTVARVEGIPNYIRHSVVKGDTLWKLSRQNYKTGFLWPLICEQNGIPNCHRIRVGDVLRMSPQSSLNKYPADELERYRQTAYRAK